MLHEQISFADAENAVNVAAVWPASAQIAPVPIPDIIEPRASRVQMPTPSAPDVPGGVGVLIVGSYVALLAALAVTAVASVESNRTHEPGLDGSSSDGSC